MDKSSEAGAARTSVAITAEGRAALDHELKTLEAIIRAARQPSG